MRVVTIDFETYFDSKTYTLTKVGPIEYIRDPRFTVLCVGARVGRGETVVCEARDGQDVRFLKELELERPDTLVVGHNMAGFDALILSEYYKIHPAIICDTIAMMHWTGLSRISSCTHKALTALLGHGIKQAGTVVSDGKKSIDEFTPEEWSFFKQYCADDVTQCSENFASMLPYMTTDALKLISLTAKMATEPAFVPDLDMLNDYLRSLDNEAELARERLAAVLHYKTTAELMKAIRSPITFPKLLEAVGGKCPMKWSDKKQAEVPACSKQDLAFTAMAKDPNPNVALLVQTRLNLNSSIQRSRAESMTRKGALPVPIMLSSFKAHTGRYTAGGEEASDKLNFQNLSKRDPSKLTIRKALKVPDGYAVVACDSSQIEARMLAWEAEQDDLVDQFRRGADPYAELASRIFGQSAEAIHNGAKDADAPDHALYKKERNVGKTCVLSCGYGVSAQRFSDTLLRQNVRLADSDAEHFAQAAQAHSIYRRVNFKIVEFWSTCGRVIQDLCSFHTAGVHGYFGRGDLFEFGWDNVPCASVASPYIKMPNGFRLWYPGLRYDDEGGMVYDRVVHGKPTPKRVYGASIAENVTQSLAFQMLAWQACRMADAGIQIKANIHDAFIAVCKSSELDRTKQIMEKIMKETPSWLSGFPVDCEAETGNDFTIA